MDLRAPSVTARRYRDDRDWWAIRSLLVDAHARVGPGWNWDVRRWDGWRFHRESPMSDEGLASTVAVWESPDGRVVGAVHPEAGGDAHLELDPAFRHLEGEMIGWAEDHLAGLPDEDGRRALDLWVLDEDAPRRQLLKDRGYAREAAGAWLRLLSFGTTRPPSSVVAPDGSFAAHVGVSMDAVNDHAIVEPVCTHPDHRRVGLARALLLEGLGRVRARSARTAQVDTGEAVAANELYGACGFTDAHHLHLWRRWAPDRGAAVEAPDRSG
jgi:ribosomal protein S18 acetylase RimI-like enzyme